jgi:hypothetical protein
LKSKKELNYNLSRKKSNKNNVIHIYPKYLKMQVSAREEAIIF